MSNISFLPDHHLLLKNNQQWQNFWMIYNMTMIGKENFCLPTSHNIIKFCIWHDSSFSLNFKAIEKCLENCGRTGFEIVSPTADFETIKNGIALVARLLQYFPCLYIPSLSCDFIPCEEVDKLEGTDFFPSEIRSINYRWHSNIAVCACADTSYFRLSGDKVFLRIFS